MRKNHLIRFSAVLLIAALASLGTAAGQSYKAPVHNLPPVVQSHVDLACLIGNGAVSEKHLPQFLMGISPDFPYKSMTDTLKVLPPTKAFDQLYILGYTGVNVVALDTSEGIILWDALNTPQDGPDIIETGMREVGLDPARIKYVVLTHFHGDHIGCAKYLQDKYHARVLMSAADWEDVNRPPRPRKAAPPGVSAPASRRTPPPPPAQDMVVTDGQKLTLGQSTVTFYITPGHTRGCISSIIPVTDNGVPHVLAFWGGTGPAPTLGATDVGDGMLAYEQSLIRFTKIGINAHVDGIVSNHGVVDGSDVKPFMMATRKKGDPNPYIVGESTYLRFMGSWIEAARAHIASLEIKAAEK